MRQAQHVLTVETTGQGFYDLTRPVGDWVAGQPVVAGMLTLFQPGPSGVSEKVKRRYSA